MIKHLKIVLVFSILMTCLFCIASIVEAHSISFVDNRGSASLIEEHSLGSVIYEAESGERINIGLYYYPSGKALSHWNLNGSPMNNGNNSLYDFDFIMPNEDVTFEAVLVDAISSVELSGTFSEPKLGEQIPSLNLQVAKVNGSTALANKVTLEYSKFQKDSKYV